MAERSSGGRQERQEEDSLLIKPLESILLGGKNKGNPVYDVILTTTLF